METFGCCSKYKECSDALRCLHSDDEEYAGCQYRKNLEAGRIFYGRNAGKVKSIEPVKKPAAKKILYIACFQQLFAVYARHKNGYSYQLTTDQFEKLLNVFDTLNIPYRTEINPFDLIDGAALEDGSPCNSRVIFEYDSESFHILNFNAYLIKEYYAIKIAKSLENKGITSRHEIAGTSQGYRLSSAVKPMEPAEIKVEEKKPEVKIVETPKVYVQTSIFDLIPVMAKGA